MIEWHEFTSPKALQGFPMQDPTTRRFPVYLPPGYPHQKQPVPTVYFLAGYPSRGSSYLHEDSAFTLPLHTRFDQAIEGRRLPPFIGVFPDCTSRLGHSQYVNSPALGHYMDYLCDELTAFIDERYPTDTGLRIVVGHSSGGFGALMTGLLRPDRFHGVGACSSDCFFELSLLPHMNSALIEIHRAGSVDVFIKQTLEKPSARQISKRQFEAILLLAMAPCFAPNPHNPPLYGDLFFDVETGEIKQSAWEKYLAWDPIRKLQHGKDNLKQLRALWLDCGKYDEYGLQWGHRQLERILRSQGVAFQSEEYAGEHGGYSWRFEHRLHQIFKGLGFKLAP